MYRFFEQLRETIPNLDELQDEESNAEDNQEPKEQEARPMTTTTLSSPHRHQQGSVGASVSASVTNSTHAPSSHTSRGAQESSQTGTSTSEEEQKQEEDPFLADLEAAGVRYDKDQLRAPKSHPPAPQQVHEEQTKQRNGGTNTPAAAQPWSPAKEAHSNQATGAAGVSSASAPNEVRGHGSAEDDDFSTAVSSWFSKVSTPLRNIDSPNTEAMQQRISSTFRKAWSSISNATRSDGASEENTDLLSSTNGRSQSSSHGKEEDAEVVSGSSLGLGASGMHGRHPGDSCLANTMWACWPVYSKLQRGYKSCVDNTKCGCLIQVLVRAVICLVTSTVWVFTQCFKSFCPTPLVERVEAACSYLSEKVWTISVKQGIAILFLVALAMLIWLTYESLWTVDAGLPRMKISRAPPAGD
eukprot:gb/GECG01014194.1/.p1 GENE.gb/GECG01014194.1/~~gb/GECG01014194.1/.p1  ORF type:complete len:413 (+),score=56.14 gb/GECG01014194.1/:1-1239(+)